MDTSFDGSREDYLLAISKARDLGPAITNEKGGAFHRGNRISMRGQSVGSRSYENVFRHEYGHALDDTIADKLGKYGGRMASWDAIDDLLADNDELLALRTNLYGGDKHTKKNIALVQSNQQKRIKLRTRLVDEVLGDMLTTGQGSAPTSTDVFRHFIPDLEPDDIKWLYNNPDMNANDAINIVASWESRDISDAIVSLPIINNGNNITHSSAFAGMQDVFEAGTGGKVTIGFGHGRKYYLKRMDINRFYGMTIKHSGLTINGHSTAQAFANWSDAYGNPNPAAYYLYKRLWPRTATRFEGLLEEFIAAS